MVRRGHPLALFYAAKVRILFYSTKHLSPFLPLIFFLWSQGSGTVLHFGRCVIKHILFLVQFLFFCVPLQLETFFWFVLLPAVKLASYQFLSNSFVRPLWSSQISSKLVIDSKLSLAILQSLASDFFLFLWLNRVGDQQISCQSPLLTSSFFPLTSESVRVPYNSWLWWPSGRLWERLLSPSPLPQQYDSSS